jgi:hypothetical protein
METPPSQQESSQAYIQFQEPHHNTTQFVQHQPYVHHSPQSPYNNSYVPYIPASEQGVVLPPPPVVYSSSPHDYYKQQMKQKKKQEKKLSLILFVLGFFVGGPITWLINFILHHRSQSKKARRNAHLSLCLALIITFISFTGTGAIIIANVIAAIGRKNSKDL